MHALLASCGILCFAFLYVAGSFVASSTIQKSTTWFDQRRICRQWPELASDLKIMTIDHTDTTCELPELSRSKSQSAADTFKAKEILEAVCNTGEECSD